MVEHLTKLQFIGGRETLWKLKSDGTILWNYNTGYTLYGVCIGRPGIKTIATAPTAGGTNYQAGDILDVTDGTQGQVKVLTVDGGTGAVLTLQAASHKHGGDYAIGAGKATTGGSGDDNCTIEITALDEGTVYAAGDRVNSKTLWRLDNEGNLMSSADVGKVSHDCAVSEVDGSVYATVGYPATGGRVLKFDQNLAGPAWNVLINAHSLFDIAVDSSGNIFAVGSYIHNSPAKSVWKLSAADGSVLASYDTKGITTGIAIDSSENVYVTGGPEDAYSDDPFVWKLTNALALTWAGNLTGYTCFGACIRVDASGNVYVGGGAGLNAPAYPRIFKFNSAGVHQSSFQIWEYSSIHDIAIGDGIYAAGASCHKSYHDVFKWNTSYVQQWSQRLGAGWSHGIAIDSENNIYVGGAPQIR
jgi:hypothetical protein